MRYIDLKYKKEKKMYTKLVQKNKLVYSQPIYWVNKDFKNKIPTPICSCQSGTLVKLSNVGTLIYLLRIENQPNICPTNDKICDKYKYVFV